MLDLRRLRVFREVATRRSFSDAALALDYTQSSVSQHVTNLERELGVTLLDRGARPVRVTEAGELVLRHADDLLGRAAAVERELAGLAGGETGTLRLGGFYTAWATFLPTAVAAYSRTHPRVQLDLRQLEPEPAVRALRSGQLDLALVYHYGEIPDGDGIAWTHLLDDAYAVALPAGHPLAAAEAVALADLARERWVSPPPEAPYTRVLRALCRDEGGFDPHVAYETGDVAMAQPLVAAGLAVALLPDLALRPRHAGVAVRPLAGAPAARAVDVGRIAGRRIPTAGPMLDALREVGEKWRRGESNPQLRRAKAPCSH
jgi:DNA-binding transcriptional LysR family regulator